MQPSFDSNSDHDVTSAIDSNSDLHSFVHDEKLDENKPLVSSDPDFDQNHQPQRPVPPRILVPVKTKPRHKHKHKHKHRRRHRSASSPTFKSSDKRTSNKLPSAVLTKQNCQSWTCSDFKEYEKELVEQLNHLKSTTPTIDEEEPSYVYAPLMLKNDSNAYNNNDKRRRRRSSNSISFQNYHEWSDKDMNQYEEEMLTQFYHLADQMRTLSQ